MATSANVIKPNVWLRLARVSNLPTVLSNSLVAMACTPFLWSEITIVYLVGSIILYVAGMILNDAFDAEWDKVNQPFRPIPAGEVTRGYVFAVGFTLLTLGGIGHMLLAMYNYTWMGLVATVWLPICIVSYNWHHKANPLSPLLMALCRSFLYVIPAAFLVDFEPTAYVLAVICLVYVSSLTLVAKLGYGRFIPFLIAGISVMDAGFLVYLDQPSLALVALVCAGATLRLQVWVRGT